MSNIYEILIKSNLIDTNLRTYFIKMVEIRNRYIHARAIEDKLEEDTIEALDSLHNIVEGTVSIFQHYDIKDGALVKK